MSTPPPSCGSSSSRPSGSGGTARQLLPLTVWLCPDDDIGEENEKNNRSQLCLRHRQAVGVNLARHLITACTGERGLVAEAYTVSDASLRAAAELGRRALACVPHLPLAQHIGGRLRTDFTKEELARLAMRPCRPDQMHRGLADHLEQVSLVIAAPPPYAPGGRPAGGGKGRGRCPACLSDALTGGELRLDGFLVAAWRVLRRGGHLAVITTTRHENDRLVDPAPQIIRQARTLGFRYSQHVIALRVPVHSSDLVVQARPEEIAQLRDIQSRALPPAVSVHADVCLFTKPRVGAQGPRGGDR